MQRYFHTALALLALVFLAFIFNDHGLPTSRAQAVAPQPALTLRVTQSGQPWINLQDGRALATAQELAAHSDAQPVALASADFNEDGVPDLVGGYASAGAGLVHLHYGNADALYPNSPPAQQRRAQGSFTALPFQAATRLFETPAAPAWLGAGDFDADGHWDVVVANAGGEQLYFLRGDGRGGLAQAEAINLPGAVTALVTGEINRADGLTDILVGVATAAGAQLLIFAAPEGALRRAPEVLALPVPATALAVGQLDESFEYDLAIAAGGELLILHGRDRQLALDETQRAKAPAAKLKNLALPFAVTSFALGDFTTDPPGQTEIAALDSAGTVHLLRRSKSSWLAEAALSGAHQPAAQLISARVSSLPTDDLLVFSRASRQLEILTTARVQQTRARFETAGAPVAILPMRLNADARSDLVLLQQGQAAPSGALTAPSATFTVNATSNELDCNPGDGLCAIDSDPGTGGCQPGACTLRAAIQEANATPGADTINFNIPGAAPHTITVNDNLGINEPVTLDGTTQPGFAGTPVIEVSRVSVIVFATASGTTIRGLGLNGDNFSLNGAYIQLNQGNNIVEGNFIGTNLAGTAVKTANACTGVVVNGGNNNRIGGTVAAARNLIAGLGACAFNGQLTIGGAGTLVQGNLIGTNLAGTASLGGGDGVYVAAANNTIGGTIAGARNLISGNGGNGVDINDAMNATGNLVQGNFIGVNATGAQALGNGSNGVFLQGGHNNTVGGTTAAARNIIAANTGNGVLVYGASELVQGNYIGTDVNGAADLGNGMNGVGFEAGATANTIGGAVAGAGNVISGNQLSGINLLNAPANTVQGNLIGTNAAGTAAIGNGADGVQLHNGNQIIGGTVAAARNVISGNGGHGIVFLNNFSGTVIQGNFIGTQADGISPLGNGLNGINADFGFNNSIGGLAAGAGNIIAFNGGIGVRLRNDRVGYPILSNAIHSNGALGIDLSANASPNGDGVTPNDPNDGDVASGFNTQNFPLLTGAFADADSVNVQGTLNSRPNLSYTLQFFANNVCDPPGNGEGQTLLGSTTVTTAGSGNASFDLVLPTAVPPGQFITATATNNLNETSEFSQCRTVTPCSFMLAPTSQNFVAAGGTGGVNVTSQGGCNWTATSNAAWITVTSGTPGVGNGTLSYSVAANTGAARSGAITIAGQSFTVNQDASCSFAINPTSQSFTAMGGNATVNVTAAAGCAWTAISNAAWLTITSGASGNGNGTVGYTVAPLGAGRTRTGTLTIAGQTFTVTQKQTVKADFDGDGRTDLSVWRGNIVAPTPNWSVLQSSNGAPSNTLWGAGYAPYFDVPVPGDYDGDGKTDHAIWRGSNSIWYIRKSSDGQAILQLWGANYAPYFDVPVPGDYDGDGKTDIAVWRPTNGTWYIIRSSDGSVVIEQWGTSGDTPVAADYDGDGKTDIAVWRGTDTNWYIKRSTGGVEIISWGAGYAPYFDVPVPADYDGDGKADAAIWRGGNSIWYIRPSATPGNPITQLWGASYDPYNDVPAPGDYDGDGRADIAVWRPTNGTWYVIRSTNGTLLVQAHGQAGDTPVPSTGVR